MKKENAMTQVRAVRFARFFVDVSSPSEVDFTDELVLDRAYDEAVQQITYLARNSAPLPDLNAMERLICELSNLLRDASGEDVDHAGRIGRALSGTDFEYASGMIGRRLYSGFVSLFPMNATAR
ncbi:MULTISPECIES: hypothetical protein [Rhizobium]|uniref:hypothetical protein n=1 Tax=Rhizobium TaxID=379 RepID=UPI00102FAD6A|nr:MULTISPECIES: hypothetical protein [Rhizobium]TAX30756.1 hypothetical protein ELI04_13720 [Rhizobium leguminosarum]TBD43300.1 hypothetical protein ELH19_14260 [Rhizobium ruizarguesonis]